MFYYLRKMAAFTILVLASQLSFAGTMGCTAINATIPCEFYAWDFGISGLYLQSIPSRDLSFNTATVEDGFVRFRDRHEKWGWGVFLEGSYHFGTGNDINVNWYHYKNRRRIFGTDFILAPFLPDIFLQFKPRWNAVNLEVGQEVDFGLFDYVRFHGGMQYARVTQSTDLFNTFERLGYVFTRFTGIGPRLGTDMYYSAFQGLSIYAKGAGAILVGNAGFIINTGQFMQVGSPIPVFNAHGHRAAIVPELEGKLGATFDYIAPLGIFGLDVGYMWINYFNLQNIIFADSDFALHGVYFGLKYVGSV